MAQITITIRYIPEFNENPKVTKTTTQQNHTRSGTDGRCKQVKINVEKWRLQLRTCLIP